MHIDAPDAARHLAAYSKHSVAVHYIAVTYHYVTGWCVKPPSVLVAAGLDDHSVIALVKTAVLHYGVLCHLQVYAVIVVAVRIDIQIVRPHIATHKQMDGPERAFAYMETV